MSKNLENLKLLESIAFKRSINPAKAFNSQTRKQKPTQVKTRSVISARQENEEEEEAYSKTGLSQLYINITGFPFPLGPLLQRKTIRTEVEPGCIWLFEQQQGLGLFSVTTNIRMTVIKLSTGGLWVHSPIAPTQECVQLLKDLNAPVEHIILPTFAYEHKIFVGPFSRKFPKAQVWTAPSQWSWPLNLPQQFLGIFPTGNLVDGDNNTPWANEIEQKVLQCPEVGIGPYVEVSFFHKNTKTLLVTDAVIYIPKNPLPIVSSKLLLQSAQNGLAVQILSGDKQLRKEPVNDSPATRALGWQRMVLLILFFAPSNLLEPAQSFAEVSEKLIVSPVIKTLVFNKVPVPTRQWVDSMTKDWKFKQIIPAHFAAPVQAGPKDLQNAFCFLDDLLPKPAQKSGFVFSLGSIGRVLSSKPKFAIGPDMKTLSTLDEFLVSLGAVKKTVSGKANE